MPVSDRIGAGDPENRCGRPTVLLEIRRLIRKMSIAKPLWKRKTWALEQVRQLSGVSLHRNQRRVVNAIACG